MIPQAELTGERLAQTIVGLMTDGSRLYEMSQRARSLSHHDAAARVARMVAELAEKKHSAISIQHSAD